MLHMRGKKARKRDTRRLPRPVLGAHGRGLTSVLSVRELAILRATLRLRADVDMEDISPLFAAVALNKLDLVKSLLDEGQPEYNQGPGGVPVLVWAVEHGREQAALELASRSAAADGQDAGGSAAALAAASAAAPAWGEAVCVELWRRLAARGRLSLHHANQAGYTLLHYAAQNNWPDATSWLLSRGANADRSNAQGETPLILAAARGQEEVVRRLLEGGADALLEDKRCCSGLCYSIAHVLQKRLPLPNHTINALIDHADLENYLRRRLKLLEQPPEDSRVWWPDTVTDVLLHVFSYAARHEREGLKLLLRMRVFAKIAQALQQHVSEPRYARALCELLSDLLRFCSCCYGAGNGSTPTEDRLMDICVRQRAPEACLAIITTHASSEPRVAASALKTLMLPLVSSGRPRAWLQAHMEQLGPHYTALQSRLGPVQGLDQCHAQLLRDRLDAFHRLWQHLQKGGDPEAFGESSEPADTQVQTAEVVGEAETQDKQVPREEVPSEKGPSDADVGAPDERPAAEPTPEGTSPRQRPEDHQEADSAPSPRHDAGDQSPRSTASLTESPADEQLLENSAPAAAKAGDGDVEVLDALLSALMRRYQRKWDHERRQGYPGLSAGVSDADRARLAEAPSQPVKVPLPETPQPPITSNLPLKRAPGVWLAVGATPVKLQVRPGTPVLAPLKVQQPQMLSVVVPQPPAIPLPTVQSQPLPPIEGPARWRTELRALSSLPLEHAQLLPEANLVLSGPAARRRFLVATCGYFGPVELGLRLRPAPSGLAVKRLPMPLGAAVSQLMPRLLQLYHSNLLQYALCIQNRCAAQPEVLLATPLCECNLGELLVVLKNNGSLNQRSHGLVRQLLSGLHYLHSLNGPVVHGNLKPSNVLFDEKGLLKLAEFGLHQLLYQNSKPHASSVIWWSYETSIFYEQTRQMSCSIMSDIQVAGMLVHFILTGGNHPFGVEATQIVQNIRRGISAPATINCEANDLISWMVLHDPGQRPSVEKALRHIYFWEVDKKWKFLLTCAGISLDCKATPLPLPEFFACLEKQAAYYNTKGDWVSKVRACLPELAPSDTSYSSTPVGLLSFMRNCLKNLQNKDFQMMVHLQQFFVSAFPGLILSLYRFIEKTEWVKHPALAPFVDETGC